MRTVRQLIYRDVFWSVFFVAVAFLSLFFFIDFVDEVEHVGRNGYTLFVAAIASLLEQPGHVYELFPIAVLIGTIYSMARLAQSSEYTILRTAGLGPIEFTDEKQQTLEFADRQGDNFARLFGLIGSFTVVAGVLLLINIFVMLSEERKSELGTLRALGFTRRHLIRVFGVEGTAYSLLAAALGVVTGIGVGAIVVRATEGIFAQGQRGIVDLRFSVTPIGSPPVWRSRSR